VFVPLGVPPNTSTAYCPSDSAADPLFVVVSVCVVPVNEIAPTPFVRRSMICKFVLVVLPHVPDCSPVAISSMPTLLKLLAIHDPYAAISVQIVPEDGTMAV
jgi:hypothetical protein